MCDVPRDTARCVHSFRINCVHGHPSMPRPRCPHHRSLLDLPPVLVRRIVRMLWPASLAALRCTSKQCAALALLASDLTSVPAHPGACPYMGHVTEVSITLSDEEATAPWHASLEELSARILAWPRASWSGVVSLSGAAAIPPPPPHQAVSSRPPCKWHLKVGCRAHTGSRTPTCLPRSAPRHGRPGARLLHAPDEHVPRPQGPDLEQLTPLGLSEMQGEL